ncbi:DUF2635 domain-containing protein [Gluconacetobacter azotocaptans]|uniref:DUF2635 domain-containing protein n=1 Tax=Gluconacetobacter azotocaptans TaxID=142834 RepID=A0A7W4PD15_9PROT|nr:DUF2635 domain-containing protein [Gluconacetobacter azotocaptans]MBB2189210.1 DUF2635 domain-containing protein [Gluconacetobacter azotocaptans]GBQ32272.1 hypothetical protein AA13594_2318 [Gluconacetobacter azotocaptans DSM 13594]
MFVKPAPGRAVRWPGTRRLLSEAGETVPETTFWLLCERNGDVVKATPPVAAPVAAQPAPAIPPAPEVQK